VLWVAAPAKPATRTAAPAAAPGPMQKVAELAQSAQARYETADFAEAIKLWTEAYDLLPESPEFTSQRNVLAYQIGQACLEAYAIDPQVAYLRKADVLLSGYLQTIDPQDAETRAEIEGRLAEIRGKIAESERLDAERLERERQEAERAREAAEAAKRPDPAIEAARKAEEEKRRKAAEREKKLGRRLSIAGGVTAGVGVSLLAVMGYGLSRGATLDDSGDAEVATGMPDQAMLQDFLDKGVAANRLAVATGAIGGALLVAGVALVSTGVVREKRARKALALTPTWLRGGAGLALTGRF
jgi:hypothetical protein